jgi:GDPmannose 4,6-dehydratase
MKKQYIKKTALITGINGMDGSHLADFLLEKDYFVVSLKRRTSIINTSRIDHLYHDSNFKKVFDGLCSLVKQGSSPC